MQGGILDWILKQKRAREERQVKSEPSPELRWQYCANVNFLVLIIIHRILWGTISLGELVEEWAGALYYLCDSSASLKLFQNSKLC